MKSFQERSPIAIGLVSLVVIAAGTLGAILLDTGNLPFVNPTYTVTAQFRDAAGIRPGAKVLVAGVRSGEVQSVETSEDGKVVDIEMTVQEGVELPRNAHAAVEVDTVLGSKSISLELPVTDEPDWSVVLADSPDEPRIPVDRTTTPIEAVDLQDIGTEVVQGTDAEALNQLVTSLADITEGTRDDVTTVITSLNRLTTAVNQRDGEAAALLEAAAELSTVLADRDAELAAIIDDLDVVVGTLDDRRGDLVALLRETARTSAELSDLLGDHRDDLDSVLADIDATLEVVDGHQLDLAAGVAYLASAIEGFSGIGYSGPDRTPHPWANIFVQGAGPGAVDPVLGACGYLDIALDAILGDDPAGACVNRDDPVTASSAPDATVFTVRADDGSTAASVDALVRSLGYRA